MPRYIDADALLEKAWDADTRIGYVQVVDVGDVIDAPTVSPDEVRGVGKWINVNERMPDSGERVLIMFKPDDEEECISIGWLTKSGFDCYDDSVYFFRPVTHWMPLPSEPREGD